MCRADEPISVQLPIARALANYVQDLVEPELQPMCVSIIGLLFDKFNIEEQNIHGLTMFLDPRFQDRMANNKLQFNLYVSSWIQEECEKETEVPASDLEVHSPPSKQTNSFFSKHNNLFRDRK